MKISTTASASKLQKLLTTALSLMLGVACVSAPAEAAPLKQLQVPQNRPAQRRAAPQVSFTPDVLLVMPDAKAEGDDIKDALKEAHGTVVGVLGEGKFRCLIIKTEKGKLAEVEGKLTKDKKHFSAVGRNYRIAANVVPNDPNFPSQWHLAAINCPRAWDRSTGGVTMAVLDSGCQASISDLSGKTQKGYDATTAGSKAMGGTFMALGGYIPGVSDAAAEAAAAASGGAQSDNHGHGTWVATTAAASFNNAAQGSGVAPSANIYPIKIADGSPGTTIATDDLSLVAAMMVAMNRGARIVNLSYGAPYVGFHNPALHAPLHVLFSMFYATRNGLIFMSAGNDGIFDATPPVPYINMVSAVDPTGNLASFSNYGPCVKFTAPGTGIVVSDINGTTKTVQGTSFSAPIAASVAALVCAANPALPNIAVENILKASCINVSGSALNMYYGYGMPDAERAVQLAKGI
jgi:thermitase